MKKNNSMFKGNKGLLNKKRGDSSSVFLSRIKCGVRMIRERDRMTEIATSAQRADSPECSEEDYLPPPCLPRQGGGVMADRKR